MSHHQAVYAGYVSLSSSDRVYFLAPQGHLSIHPPQGTGREEEQGCSILRVDPRGARHSPSLTPDLDSYQRLSCAVRLLLRPPTKAIGDLMGELDINFASRGITRSAVVQFGRQRWEGGRRVMHIRPYWRGRAL